jgi:hypothetical protein
MADKRERGRPPKSPEERKESMLVIRLTEAELAAIEAAAAGKASTWAREQLLRLAKRRKK